MDLFANLLTLSVMLDRTLLDQGYEFIDSSSLRILGSCAGLLTWLQLVFWLRLFDSTAMYVSLIIRTAKDISYFMIVLLLIMCGFTTAFYLLQMNRVYDN